MSDLKVAMASPEITPFAKTGGLGDVLGALPKALVRLGLQVSLIMPAHRQVLRGGFSVEDTGIRFTVPIANRREEGVLLKVRYLVCRAIGRRSEVAQATVYQKHSTLLTRKRTYRV